MTDIIAIAILWALFCSILNAILITKSKKRISIRLPKPLKYRGRKSPIYKLDKESNLIFKYELKYVSKDWVIMLYLFIPFPIEIKKYEYCMSENYYRCDPSIISSLEEFYESRHRLQLKEIEEWKLKEEKEQSIYTKLNKEFNENYID